MEIVLPHRAPRASFKAEGNEIFAKFRRWAHGKRQIRIPGRLKHPWPSPLNTILEGRTSLGTGVSSGRLTLRFPDKDQSPRTATFGNPRVRIGLIF